MDVDPSDILSKVDPVTATGYTLTKKEMTEAKRLLAERQWTVCTLSCPCLVYH